jgi:enoyl-CoA hydratase/carnithine racemase
MSEHVVVESQGGVTSIRLHRPEKKNALTFAMYGAMTEALRAADADPAVRAVAILGGEGAFTAGNDIGDFARIAAGGGDVHAPLRFLEALATFGKPVVAGVTGLAIGIGTTLLLHCDLAYAVAGARFKTPFVDLGLTPEAGSSLLFPQLMGHRRAAALLLLGEELDAEGAREAGLVNAIVPDANAAALDAAKRVAGKAPGAVAESKRLMKRAQAALVAETMKVEGEVFAARLRSPEAMAAFMAFAKK